MDKRWLDEKAILTTAHTIDLKHYIHRRKPPNYFGISDQSSWSKDQKPLVSLDLFHSKLRDKEATPWKADFLNPILKKSSLFQKVTSYMNETAKEVRIEGLIKAYATFPQCFLAKEYPSFDSLHPNKEGHKVITQKVCEGLPDKFECNCKNIEKEKLSKDYKVIDLHGDF